MDDALVRAMEVVHAFVHGEGDMELTLRNVTDLATEAVGAAMAGLTIMDDRGRASTVVYTDRMVAEIDQAQYDNDRGPCLDAARTKEIFEVQDTQDEGRWPEFAASANAHGVRSTLSVPVVVAADGLGALNFYGSEPSFFAGDDKRRMAILFAGQAAITSQYWTAAQEATNLTAAMESRAAIEQAKGIIMATTRCTADEAFDLLRQQSQRENRKLRELAVEPVERQPR